MAVIHIVEDDQNIREIESYALKNVGYDVEDFSDAKSFYERLKQKTPTLILLDIMLPDEDGLTVLKTLRSKPDTKNIPIIMVTAKTTELDKVRGLDMGADDYMTKPFGIMELISRVKALLRRTADREVDKYLQIGDLFLDNERRSVKVADEVVDLTYKEYELLKLLMNNAGIVTPRDTILDRVWGTDFEGESRTLDMHIKTLRQKLKDHGKMIKTVRNVGYIISNE